MRTILLVTLTLFLSTSAQAQKREPHAALLANKTQAGVIRALGSAIEIDSAGFVKYKSKPARKVSIGFATSGPKKGKVNSVSVYYYPPVKDLKKSFSPLGVAPSGKPNESSDTFKTWHVSYYGFNRLNAKSSFPSLGYDFVTVYSE